MSGISLPKTLKIYCKPDGLCTNPYSSGLPVAKNPNAEIASLPKHILLALEANQELAWKQSGTQ